MNLKKDFNMADLMEVARDCTGDVFFHSVEGDIINLKSLLSQYMLASIVCKPGLLVNARVVCTQDEDYARLADFLQ